MYLACEAITAAGVPEYNYIDDYISELGVAATMNVGGFIAHGALFLAGAVVFARSCPTLGPGGFGFVLAAAANAVGNILVGTIRTGALHVVGSALAILGGNIAVIVAGIVSRRLDAPAGYRRASIALGVIGIGCLLILAIDGVAGSRILPVGIVERGAVYPIIAWELLTGTAILRRHLR